MTPDPAIETGSAHDVSLIWLALYAAGSAVWISYGVAIDSLPLVISQSAALVCVTVALFLAARHRREDGQVDQTERPPRPRERRATLGEAQRGHASTPERRVPAGSAVDHSERISRATGEASPTRSTTRSTSL